MDFLRNAKAKNSLKKNPFLIYNSLSCKTLDVEGNGAIQFWHLNFKTNQWFCFENDYMTPNDK